jgi:hypothetical protein
MDAGWQEELQPTAGDLSSALSDEIFSIVLPFAPVSGGPSRSRQGMGHE